MWCTNILHSNNGPKSHWNTKIQIMQSVDLLLILNYWWIFYDFGSKHARMPINICYLQPFIALEIFSVQNYHKCLLLSGNENFMIKFMKWFFKNHFESLILGGGLWMKGIKYSDKRSRHDWMKKECCKHGYFCMFIMQVQVKNKTCRCYFCDTCINM